MEPELEIMALPNKETLEFYDKIFDWLTKKDRDNDNKIVYTFSKDVPKEIIELFLKIRDKIELPISEQFYVES
ncbi:hypothetical protein [Ligilactobacillus murinus]|jgi:effector-binding domain-containing protein|uniref:Uncharacterized protein n=1 Tax=Ligilactobacillus murinus TaxID=1622 RepID=A0A4Q2AM40_9LACO|nr:hypothetical protein [Ligilactobacillus murinus]NBH86261.1 hypothetical protein [Lachnospiraceae bacterium]HAP23080.1 hypothetical protein [Lactobacillus sp.]MBF0700659.1 hypothetical protein [Ligilactobacillus murinus]MBX9013557.1 hypothetical protein [Ligilactobacillus murinus]MCR1881308.1 hypothetical protein [Ligilactobacillus murinus]